MTNSPVIAFSSCKGDTTFYTFKLNLLQEIKSQAKLKIKFPNEFSTQLGPLTGEPLECILKDNSNTVI